MTNDPGTVTLFVDEADDPTLFGKGGKVVAANEGCSRFFIAGKLECRDVDALSTDLERLRKDLVADPFFKSDRHSGIFNKEHPPALESRAGVGKMDREIEDEPDHLTAWSRFLFLEASSMARRALAGGW